MLYLCYLYRFKPLRDHLRGFLIAAWAGDKIAEFSFPEISFHFPLRPWFFFVSPAYAGKSPAAAYACPGTQDHPRVCVSRLCRVRITPACAGKSTKSRNAIRSRWDHPRMCGEKPDKKEFTFGTEGSPPHVRGKVTLRPTFA